MIEIAKSELILLLIIVFILALIPSFVYMTIQLERISKRMKELANCMGEWANCITSKEKYER